MYIRIAAMRNEEGLFPKVWAKCLEEISGSSNYVTLLCNMSWKLKSKLLLPAVLFRIAVNFSCKTIFVGFLTLN